MVISKILRLLQVHRPQLRIKSVLAMHIDYGNRPESAAEAAYVQRWCEGDRDGDSTGSGAMLGGLACRVRRVDEVTRGVTSRDEYEKVSRDIRYGFYRACMAEEVHVQSGGETPVLLSGVIFGHHLGDVQENVISNVMR
jgi:tRNA(Ile)-lysidine synthase TilS/MesJ